jgi:hypothetical protein
VRRGGGEDIGHIAGIVVAQRTFIVHKRGQEVRSILVYMVHVCIYIYTLIQHRAAAVPSETSATFYFSPLNLKCLSLFFTI